LSGVDDPQAGLAEDHPGDQLTDNYGQRASGEHGERRTDEGGSKDQGDQTEVHGVAARRRWPAPS
jgi:hypothetical protein